MEFTSGRRAVIGYSLNAAFV